MNENIENMDKESVSQKIKLSPKTIASLSKFLTRTTLNPNEIDEFLSLLKELNSYSSQSF